MLQCPCRGEVIISVPASMRLGALDRQEDSLAPSLLPHSQYMLLLHQLPHGTGVHTAVQSCFHLVMKCHVLENPGAAEQWLSLCVFSHRGGPAGGPHCKHTVPGLHEHGEEV